MTLRSASSVLKKRKLMQNHLRLILVTHRQQTSLADYLDFIRLCVVSGVTAIQLREKEATPEFLYEFGRGLQEVLAPFQIPLIINDHLSLAQTLNADGIHLGQSDGDPVFAKSLFPHKIIGLSIEEMDNVEKANQLSSISYVAASSVFPTPSKQNVKTIWQIEGLRQLVEKSCHPVVAIGGIDLDNLQAVADTGIAGVAIIRAIHNAQNPLQTIHRFRQILDGQS